MAASFFWQVQTFVPPNQGDLTLAQFVENYNFYAERFDEEGLTCKALPFREDGTADLPLADSRTETGREYWILNGYQESYWEPVQEGGRTVGFRYVLIARAESFGDSYFTSYSSSTMRLGLLAFAGAQPEAGWRDFGGYRWMLPLPDMWSYDFIADDLQVTQTVTFPDIQPGHMSPYSIDFPAGREGTIRLEFTVREESTWDKIMDMILELF